MQKVLIQAKEENYYELFLLEFATGLRLGELTALQWDDLDLNNGELRINKQATIIGSEVVITEPKTKAAIRTLVLPPQVVNVFREYKARVNSKWLFPSPKKEDMPLRPSVVHQRLHRILDHAGCERVRFHDLRHTFATNALAHGMDIKTLSTILGHVSSATTLNTYSHITDEMRQKAAAKIDKGIAKSGTAAHRRKHAAGTHDDCIPGQKALEPKGRLTRNPPARRGKSPGGPVFRCLWANMWSRGF